MSGSGVVSRLGLFAAGLIVAAGTLWAFQRGAQDFAVFYQSWVLVLAGRGAEIYHVSPDRFLYAPGFAWLLSPLALLPREVSLSLWCFAKALVVGWLIRDFAFNETDRGDLRASGVRAWAVVLLARPLLIDFQYGQVNTFILGACCWALLNHFRGTRRPWVLFLSWFALAVAAVGKLFALPVLLVPWLVRNSIPSARLRMERLGAIAGVAVITLLPVMTEGLGGLTALYGKWREALLLKGLPLDSHNQSFSAFLHHYFSGLETHVISHGPERFVRLGWELLSPSVIQGITWIWFGAFAGGLLTWIWSGSRRAPLSWIAGAVGLIFVPSHLIWKPYFLFGLPAAFLALKEGRRNLEWLAAIFILVNLTGFDFLGRDWGGRFESAAVLLWCHLALLWLGTRSGGLSQKM